MSFVRLFMLFQGTQHEMNLGIASGPQFDNDSQSFFIEYTNGTTACNSNTSWITHIDFVCPDDGEPVR